MPSSDEDILDETLQTLLAGAKANLARDGYLIPTVLIVGDKLEVHEVYKDAQNARQRQKEMLQLGIASAASHPAIVFEIVDSYILDVNVEAGEEIPSGSLADQPRAQDAIAVSAMTRTGLLFRGVTLPYTKKLSLTAKMKPQWGEPRNLPETGLAYNLVAFWVGVAKAHNIEDRPLSE